MSASRDHFAEAWKSVDHKLNTGTRLNMPRPKVPPKVSIYATHEFVHTNKPFLTWKPELVLWGRSKPDIPEVQQTLVELIPEDNFEQLEKIYQHLYAVAELEEHHKARLAKANTELEEWKHVAEDCRARLAESMKKDGDYAAVAWHEAILDRAQGRVIHWGKIVAREQRRVQQQESRVDELETPYLEAMDVLEQSREPTLDQRPSTDVHWCVMVYLTVREDAEIKC
ncbi:hypothetical protein KCU65_g9681, partial [Aureobasidium melanogenum]